MALRPLWNNVWGVPVYQRPYSFPETLHTPFAKQRKKMENLILVKEVGKDCLELSGGEIVVLPEDHGGAVITIFRAGGEVEYRFCFNEENALAVWGGALPATVTEAGIVNIEE